MNKPLTTGAVIAYAPEHGAPEISISHLVARIYEAASVRDRCHLLEHLMKPLGVLSLVTVANGFFAKIWFRSGWHELQIQPEDTGAVRAADIVSLVDFVQQASNETIAGLTQLLTASPTLAGIAASALLVSILLREPRPDTESC